MSERASQKQHREAKDTSRSMQARNSSAQQRPQTSPLANWTNQSDTVPPPSDSMPSNPCNQPPANNLAATIGSQSNSSQPSQYPQHPYNFQSGFHNLVAAAATIAHQSQEIRNYPNYDSHYAAQSWGPSFTQLLPPKRPYANGVDELILAAKIEESSSRAAISTVSQIVPSGSLVTTSAYSGYPSNTTPCHSAQQTAFIAPYIPYVPTGRGLGYPPFSTINRDSVMQMQPTPRSKSELELYNLLEKANLLQYFETFLKFGGDDVQQLSDADEEEFIEIMTLIGMTNKPLHIRRLQKALSDWREIQGVYDSLDTSFKRPNLGSKSQQHQSPSISTQNLYNSHQTGERISSKPSSFMVESPAPTPTDSEVSQPTFALNEQPQQQFCTPLEVIVGAPKRPRLMDSIKPRDLTKTYHSDIPTPDVRQLNVRQAIIDKRKRAKMGLEQNPRTSSLNRSYDDDIKLTPTSNSPPSPNWNASESSCGPYDESDAEKEHEHKANDSIVQVELIPKKRPSARASLLSRFNNSSNESRPIL